jgi:hypothetical protein
MHRAQGTFPQEDDLREDGFESCDMPIYLQHMNLVNIPDFDLLRSQADIHGTTS